jgi:anti-repressor protein
MALECIQSEWGGLMKELANEMTMTSREIAELVESRHDSVKRTIETLRNRGLVRFSQSVETSHDGAGARPVLVFRVNKRDSYVIVAQLSPEFTARLVDRWQALEEAIREPAFYIPKTLGEALRLAADHAEQIAEQQQQLERQKPAVDFARQIRDVKDGVTIEEFAKAFGTGRNRMFARLRDERILMPNNLPFQEYLERGYFEVRETSWVDSHDERHPSFQTLVTGRGQIWLTTRLNRVAANISVCREAVRRIGASAATA